ncbi:MAG: hypothetical protein SFV17_08515 [Candidatus Obscuribacter sp.]|nr:hypothetical protein [Candidatus Obscuribacter sp.]
MSKSERQESDAGLSQETAGALNAAIFSITAHSQKDFQKGQEANQAETKSSEPWLSPITLTEQDSHGEGGLKLKSAPDSSISAAWEANFNKQETPLNLPIYNLAPTNFRLRPGAVTEQSADSTESFRLKPLPAEPGKLNLDLPRNFLQTENYRLQNFAPEFKPLRRDWREALDRAVTFELNLGSIPLEMSLNTRKCGMRARPGLCFRKKLD